MVVALSLSVNAARISNVNVDLVKGCGKYSLNAVDTVFEYMGRLTYTFVAEGKDSVFLDFAIAKQGGTDTALVYEKTGDWGQIRQVNAADTLKTINFRVRLTNDISGNYVATVNAQAAMSGMWKLADSLVKLMTLDQKMTFLYSWTTVNDLSGFGSDDITLNSGKGPLIAGWRSADGPNGIRFPVTGPANEIAIFGSGNPATVFATEAARGCTWDTAMARRVGAAIAREARAMGIYCNLGPMSDLVVNPRWGRAFETMGEDPFLVGKMASHQVMGIQDEHVIATPKHFTPYFKEETRDAGQRVIVSERALRELFCVPFEMDLREGNARALMTCYNKVRVPGYTTDNQAEILSWCDRAASNRHLLNDIVRNDWGFDGVIMTDWRGAANVDETYAFNTAFDMSMPIGDALTNAVTNINTGKPGWSVDTMNRKVRNIMYAKLWAWGGNLIPNDAAIKTYPQSAILSRQNLQLTLDEARESIVLARNDSVNGAPALPLDRTASIKVAVVGPYANMYRPGGGGSSAVTPDSQITPLQGIQAYIAATAGSKVTITTDYTTADAAVVFVGVDKEQESNDRPAMTLTTTPVDQPALVSAVLAKVKRTIVVYTGGSASVEGSWSSAPGVVVAFYPGRNQARALAEILFGAVNPSGHLSVTFPKTVNDLPSFGLTTDFEITYPSADSAHGYFYFEKTGKTPLFWFGHGLSYTTFSINSLQIVGPAAIAQGERVDVVASVTNTGTRDGDQVVQLYVKPPAGGSVARRVKDLRGFCRVTLAAGETKNVKFTLGPRDFSVYTVNTAVKTGAWTVVPGAYEIIAGSTSNPVELAAGNGKSATVTVTVQ
jgi:beta-glucosidase